jgi:hypothetical protein
MSETQQRSQGVPEPVNQPRDTPNIVWTSPAQHRRTAVVWLIALLTVLQVTLAGIVVV